MNKLLPSLVLIVGMVWSGAMEAQQWCPPGAEWRYPYITLEPEYGPNGTLQYRYMGDSLFQGEACQYFESWVYLYDTAGTPQQLGPWHHFTSTAPGLIRFWNTFPSPPHFDTLAYFDAAPGTNWTFHGFGEDKVITVQDTGTRVVEGIPLRYVVITSSQPWIGIEPDTIYERIGALSHDNFRPLINYFMESPVSGLGCYRDDEIEYVSPWYESSCNSPVSVEERSPNTGATLHVYPNPGHDRVWLDPTPGGHLSQLVVRDAVGRIMGEWLVTGISMELNTAVWPPGLYLLELMDRRGRRGVTRWTKM
jgi:hypothetical protein